MEGDFFIISFFKYAIYKDCCILVSGIDRDTLREDAATSLWSASCGGESQRGWLHVNSKNFLNLLSHQHTITCFTFFHPIKNWLVWENKKIFLLAVTLLLIRKIKFFAKTKNVTLKDYSILPCEGTLWNKSCILTSSTLYFYSGEPVWVVPVWKTVLYCCSLRKRFIGMLLLWWKNGWRERNSFLRIRDQRFSPKNTTFKWAPLLFPSHSFGVCFVKLYFGLIPFTFYQLVLQLTFKLTQIVFLAGDETGF